MGDCKINSSCETTKPEHKQKDSCCGKMIDSIKAIANDAWAELLKDKIKEQFEIKTGQKMDKIAEVAADASIEYWKHKIQAKEACKEYEHKLFDVIKSY